MKKQFVFYISIILLQFGGGHTFGQDYIVKLNHETNSFYGRNLTLVDNILKFENDKNHNLYELSVDDVFSIKFNENGPAEIIIQSLKLDTIKCQLDSISPSAVYYRQENQFLKSIDKNEIFTIYFNDNQQIPDIDKYEKLYFDLNKASIQNDLKVIRKNGEIIKIAGLNSIDSEKVNISLISNGVELKTYANISDLDGIILKEPLKKKPLNCNNTFLLSTNNNWYSVRYIRNIKNESMELSIHTKSNETISIPQKKEGVCAIFFIDYKSTFNKNSKIGDLTVQDVPSIHKYVKMDINFGVGHIIANAPEGIDSETEKYYDEMRTGFFFDANFKVFPTKGFGIGIKYNQFETSNSIASIVEDNIKVSFIGLSLTANRKFKNNLGYGFFDFSIGKVNEVNNAKLFNESFVIKGTTIGFYVSSGIDFLLTDYISIGFQGGLLGGKIDKAEVNGQTIKLDEPDNLLRIDGVIGLKFYF